MATLPSDIDINAALPLVGSDVPVAGRPVIRLLNNTIKELRDAIELLENTKLDVSAAGAPSQENFTTALKLKLENLVSNTQGNWTQSDTGHPSYINNKPTMPSELTDLDTSVTGTELNQIKTKVDNLGTIVSKDTNDYYLKTEVDSMIIKVKSNASTNPTVNNDSSTGYSIFSLWINITTGNVFMCIDPTPESAVWRQLTFEV